MTCWRAPPPPPAAAAAAAAIVASGTEAQKAVAPCMPGCCTAQGERAPRTPCPQSPTCPPLLPLPACLPACRWAPFSHNQTLEGILAGKTSLFFWSGSHGGNTAEYRRACHHSVTKSINQSTSKSILDCLRRVVAYVASTSVGWGEGWGEGWAVAAATPRGSCAALRVEANLVGRPLLPPAGRSLPPSAAAATLGRRCAI